MVRKNTYMGIKKTGMPSDVDNRDRRIVFFRSNRISNRIGPRLYTTQAVTRPIICWRVALWTNESDVGLRNWVLVHFNSVLKRLFNSQSRL